MTDVAVISIGEQTYVLGDVGTATLPIQIDGAPSGFKLYAIRPASIFGRLGLQNGDLVRTVNGRPFKSADDALALYASLRRASDVKVDIERASGRGSLTWRIRASK